MDDIAIKVENLSKIYKLYDKPINRLKESINPLRKKYHKDFYALKDLSFEVKKGETLGIIGKNGSGKSTLLKIITGVLTPSSGSIQVNGKISALLELGAGFNPDYTGIENIYLNGTIMGYSKEEMDSKLQEILDFADIGDFIYQQVKMYSSGMFARLAFAVAINVDPDILIVDEALSVGDIIFQSKCFKKFNEIKERGKTILFVSHSIEDIIRNCNKGIVMDCGKKIFDGNVKDCAETYKTLIFNSYTPIIESKQEQEIFSHGLEINKEYFAFGNGKAEIIEACIFDCNGKPTQKLYNKSEYKFVFKVCFKEDLDNPVFGFVIRDKNALELTGTNTAFKKVYTGKFLKGDLVTISFTQNINLRGGVYFISYNCTGIESIGDVAYQRLHDLFIFEVYSEHQMLGLFDLDSSAIVER